MNNLKPAVVYPAEYRKAQTRRHEGNPFIEAQPRMPEKPDEFMTGLAHTPKKPTEATRRRSVVYRLGELSTLADVVHPFPEYKKAALAVSMMARDVYIARNPIDSNDEPRRIAIANGTVDKPYLLPDSWKSSASGYLIVSPTGTGKTTFIDSLLLRHKQVIKHENYRGTDLKCHQIVYIKISIPHDGTLKALCLAFFRKIDDLLGTRYLQQAIAVRTISQMVLLMGKVASLTSLGFIVVDEVQNLRAARGEQADFVLNLFVELIEVFGVGLVIIATPAVADVLENRVRNARKLSTKGSISFGLMARSSVEWDGYCDRMWDYTYTETKGDLNTAVRNAWYDASAGNVAFATLAFQIAQRDCIMSGTAVDEVAFQVALHTDLAFLQPAISALKSGNPDQIARFEDLILETEFDDLRDSLGGAQTSTEDENEGNNTSKVQSPEPYDATDEFDEMKDTPKVGPAKSTGKTRRSNNNTGKPKPTSDIQLPKRDVLE